MSDPAVPTVDDIDQMEARANAATEGPWSVFAERVVVTDAKIASDGIGVGVATGHLPTDAEFIAHARTDVPALGVFKLVDRSVTTDAATMITYVSCLTTCLAS